jgi:tRNA pseudouridine55 synthase
MKNVIYAYKNIGETPLECLERVRIENGIDTDVPMTYAGRLDPMAEGQMIILVGEECKNKEKYLGLDKEYEIEILFGFSTDSYDVLGLLNNVSENSCKEKSVPERLSDTRSGAESSTAARDFSGNILSKYIKKFHQEYPRYSSKIIAMKELPEEMPTKEVEIYSIENLGTRQIKGAELIKEIINKINLVKGDFRQKEITARWSSISSDIVDTDFTILKLRVKCSSGTYMRSLAHRIGLDMGTQAIAYSIKRLFLFTYER